MSARSPATRLLRHAWILALPLLAGASPASPASSAKTIHLFNGKDLTGWTWHSATTTSKISDVWTIKDGALHSAAAPTGFISTSEAYKSFTLAVQYRHLSKANGGLFVCIADGPAGEKVWPNAIQVQAKWANVGDLINQNKGMVAMKPDAARTTDTGKDLITKKLADNIEKPLGEWNDLLITMKDGTLTVTLNGTLQNTATGITPDHGRIGIQAEGAVMEFKKVDLTPIE
jgi:hypothetical protein